jgi:hypothetical protein
MLAVLTPPTSPLPATLPACPFPTLTGPAGSTGVGGGATGSGLLLDDGLECDGSSCRDNRLAASSMVSQEGGS